MAGNRRGRIKEHCEGMHKNCDWIRNHVIDTLDLIEDKNPKLSEAMTGIGQIADQLDKLILGIYATM